MKKALLIILAFTISCTPVPKPLTPAAIASFHAIRVVKVLDVVRDAAIAANEVVPPVISTNDTRIVVLWHKTAVQVIAATPDGWKPIVKLSIYNLTCHPEAGVGPCTPQLPKTAVDRIYPFVGLALIIIAEVK